MIISKLKLSSQNFDFFTHNLDFWIKISTSVSKLDFYLKLSTWLPHNLSFFFLSQIFNFHHKFLTFYIWVWPYKSKFQWIPKFWLFILELQHLILKMLTFHKTLTFISIFWSLIISLFWTFNPNLLTFPPTFYFYPKLSTWLSHIFVFLFYNFNFHL